MKNNLGWDEVGVGKKKQVALLVVQVTEHGGLSCPDSTLRSEVCAPNNSASYTNLWNVIYLGSPLRVFHITKEDLTIDALDTWLIKKKIFNPLDYALN